MFRKFFDLFKPDKDEDDTVKVKGQVKPKYYGTVCPYPNFNASSDASLLHKSIECKGVDEDVIIAVLVKRNNEQRQKIKAVYESSTGNNLEKDLKKVLRSDMEDAALALLMTPAELDASLIWKATKGRVGTDENLLVEVLATRTNKEIQEMKTAFKEAYGRDAEDVIEGETKGDFCAALKSLLEGNKEENTEVDIKQARIDADTLFSKGEAAGDIDEAAFIHILTKRSGPQLRRTLQIYKDNLGDISLPKLVKKELKGDIQECFIALMKCAWNMPAFFADKLHDAMERHGTCEDTLIRILVGRSEIDLKKILEQYMYLYNRSVQDDIVNDTKGHYQKLLLGLCGPH